MDLNDAERYAVAALFTLALHSTHVESGVDRNGNSLSESDIAWGCPSEELFDEQLLSQVPLKLPQELLDVFWGFDCMAPAGLAPRLYAWLKVPRKAWPGLLRMPDLAGCAGSPEAVEAFVTLVRRYSAFLDPKLDFTTGQASRLQQHFSMPAEVEEQDDELQQQQQQQGASGATAAATSASSSSKAQAESSGKEQQQQPADAARKTTKHGAAAAAAAATGMPASEAVAAAAASITAAAIAAEAVTGDAPGRQGSLQGAAATQAGSAAAETSSSDAGAAAPSAADAAAGLPGADAEDVLPCAVPCVRVSSAAVASFDELHEALDLLPKEADEGTVVPAATFTPADNYKHTTSHKAVLALYELIGGCLANNTEQDVEPLFAMAAQEAETAAFTAAAAKGNKKALQQFMQQQQAGQGTGSSAQQQQKQGEAAAASGADEPRPAAAWFPSAGTGDQPAESAVSSSSSSSKGAAAGSGGGAASGGQQQQQQQQALQPQEPKQQQSQLQQVQGLASIQWYDARARVAVKRVAHWLRVPWPQVRAFEQMWSMQALSLDAASAQPKYESSSRAMQYLKVGAAAVGGGALLAVTGGLAAPAIAAGLGAAVSLAHGGAAVAAAVSGFAGSTAGTAAVTSLFGAWGASVGGGSAGRLYGEVTEFGFWDLSHSIYVDGKGPQQQQAEEEEQQQQQQQGQKQGTDAGCKNAASGGARSTAPKSEGRKGSGTADGGQPAQAEGGSAAVLQSTQQPQQQPSFLLRLFSSKPEAVAAAASSSSDDAATKATAAGAAAAAAAGPLKPPSSPAAAPPGSSSSSKAASPVKQAPLSLISLHQQQQQQQQSTSSEGLSRKSPMHLFGWGSKAAEDEDGPAPRVRSTAIRLCDDAFNTDSDEDADEFYEEYLGHQNSAGAHTPRGSAGGHTPQGSAAAHGGSGPQTPKAAAQQQQPGSTAHKQQQPGQQQGQTPGSPEVQQQQQQAPRQPAVQELRAVEVQDDPLSSARAAAAPTAGTNAEAGGQLSGAAGTKGSDSPQQQQEEPTAATEKDAAGATASSGTAGAAAAAGGAAAGAAAAAGGSAAGAAAAAGSGSAAAGAASGGVLSGLFTRKAPPPPVYVPLLPTPVNPKHKDETRMALTIAVNGCCVESMEDFVRPWDHLPSGDCDRFALVWESACLKELGGALTSFLAQQALTQVAQKSIQTFLYTGLVGALALPMTLTTAMKVAFGSKWLVALRRAQAAGKMLAMQLVQGCHGGRPVTLIGCSMGARLVFHCLLELSRLGLQGCVENVILLGAPLSCRPDRWCAARSVVAGRLINGYSVNDWTLGLLYRVHSSSSIWLQAAGMYKVEVPGVENINLSRLVASHGDYLTCMEDVLEAINMHDT